MAGNENWQNSDILSFLTDEAVVKNLAGKMAAGREIENCDTAGEASIGVVLTTETSVGVDVGVLPGPCFKNVVSGAAFSDFDDLATDADGKYRTATAGQTVIAKAMEEATAADQNRLAMILPMAQHAAAASAIASLVTLTDSTGLSGTHDDTLAATVVPTITATNPAAPAAYTAHAAGGVPVTSNAATDLDTTAAALATLRTSVATYETAISALVVDVAAILALQTVMAQNASDVAQKVIELKTKQDAILVAIRAYGIVTP